MDRFGGAEPVCPAPRTRQVTNEGSSTMSGTGSPHADWRCHLGRHHYVTKEDDNPEMRGQSYLECIRCGKKHDPPEYGPMPGTALGAGGAGG
jgi:hypothetical protein